MRFCCFGLSEFLLLGAMLASGSAVRGEDAPPTPTQPISFRADIAPILIDQCVSCHSARKAEGGYRIDTFEEAVKPGDSDQSPIVAGDPEASEIVLRIKSPHESERMPEGREPLSADAIEMISKWVSQGAEFDNAETDGTETDGVATDEAATTHPLYLIVPPAVYPASPESYPAALPLTAMASSPDGSQLLTSGYHEILVWDVIEKKLLKRIGNLPQRICAIEFSPNGETLAVGGGEPGRSGEVRLLDWPSGELRGVVARSTDVVSDLDFSDDGTKLAIAMADARVIVIETGSLKELATLSNHADWVTAIDWSEDGTQLVSASRDKSVKVQDVATGDILTNYQGHASAVYGVTFTSGGTQVLSSGGDGKLHRWNVADGAKVAEVVLGGNGFRLRNGDGFVVVPCSDGRLLKFDLATNAISVAMSGNGDWMSCGVVLATKEGLSAAGGSLSGQLKIWNLESGEVVGDWPVKP
jgi:hypothetical protein